jgi:hypothetical protein
MSALTEFLDAVRADLFDRRMVPVPLVIAVLLLGSIGYVVLGGGETAATPVASITPAATPAAPTGTTGIAVSQVSAGSTGAVSEVTSGESLQHTGPTRDPLAAPPSKAPTKSASGASAVSGSSAPSSTPGSGAATTPATPPATAPSATTPKTKAAHNVNVLFGIVPAGTTTLATDLTPYANLHTVTPFPSSAENLIELVAVSASSHSARFRFIEPMIPTGVAKCIPSPTQCEAIDLKAGSYEQLEYAPPSGGPTVLYQLELASIT